MAYINVEVPNGEYCGYCRFLQQGTVLCTLFDMLLNEDDTGMQKCSRCPKE